MLNKVRLKFFVRTRILLTVSGAACLLTALVVGKATVTPRRPPPSAPINTSQPLPPYRLTSLDGRELAADELRRGRVLLVYLTVGCAACVKEAELISLLRRDLPPDLRVYGVGLQSRDRVASFAQKLDLSFPMLLDEGQLADTLETKYFPSKYLVEEGVVTRIWYGKTQNGDELRHQLR